MAPTHCPTFFLEMDYAKMALLAFIGGLIGTGADAVVDRFGAKITMLLTFAALAVMYVLLGVVPFRSPLFAVVLVSWTLVQSAAGFSLNLFVLNLYPSDMQARGYGWASGVGRIGGMALSYRLSLLQTCIALAVAPALVFAILLLWSIGSPHRRIPARSV